jgi:hypothetical protein
MQGLTNHASWQAAKPILLQLTALTALQQLELKTMTAWGHNWTGLTPVQQPWLDKLQDKVGLFNTSGGGLVSAWQHGLGPLCRTTTPLVSNHRYPHCTHPCSKQVLLTYPLCVVSWPAGTLVSPTPDVWMQLREWLSDEA